ncbi:hypothetical protein M0802_014276 [Mischocyttarus mexicanus]|nr:hypothetical protein M0802_014276 [Mischocyttarus mexicanus]
MDHQEGRLSLVRNDLLGRLAEETREVSPTIRCPAGATRRRGHQLLLSLVQASIYARVWVKIYPAVLAHFSGPAKHHYSCFHFQQNILRKFTFRLCYVL